MKSIKILVKSNFAYMVTLLQYIVITNKLLPIAL